ncbi:MAG: hypothetical protein ACHQ1G_06400, partial [Planctomycetota bacterium]
MSDTTPKGPREKERMRRVRNLPLILILSGLALVALLQAGDFQSGKTAVLTYTQFRQLGQLGALDEIEVLSSPDQVEIKGKLDEKEIQTILQKGFSEEQKRIVPAGGTGFTDDQRKLLDKKERFRVDGVMRGVIEDPAAYVEISTWGKLKEAQSSQLWPTFLFTIAPWVLIAAFFW